MNIKRIGRALICLLLIFCLILNIAPPKAEATGAGLAGTITAVSGVTVSAPLAIGAAAIALGVMAKKTNPLVFENMVNDAVASLSAAGDWVKDGTVELLQTIDSAGQKAYYVAGEMMEDLRSWLYESGSVAEHTYSTSMSCSFMGDSFNVSADFPFGLIAVWYDDSKTDAYAAVYAFNDGSSSDPIWVNGVETICIASTRSHNYYCVDADSGSHLYSDAPVTDVRVIKISSRYVQYFKSSMDVALGSNFYSSLDLTLGHIPYAGAFTDGSSALEWAEEYARKALKVIEGGNDPDPDSQPPNDGKWFWPLSLGLTVGVLGTMSQADEWSGQTPQEFDDYSTNTEFEILNRPEFDGWQGLEIAPATNPNPDPGTNPGTGGDSGETPEVNTDYSTWFSKIYTVVESISGKLNEIPNKFQSWITDCKTAIEELPSKFAEWFNNINLKLERLGERLQTIGESIVTLGQIIVEGVENAISSLFTPSPDYFTNKVEALTAKHHNIDKFTQLGNDFKLFFIGLGSKPPIIWIDLGAATGAYLWGGRQIFLDLTWYADYKPKMDAILGAIIWLWLAWRVFLSVPGIINGASGVWGKYHRGGSRDDN